MNNLSNLFYFLLAALLLLGSNVACANTAGHVQFVNGEVQLTTAAGQTHKIKKGDAVNEGDTLTSAPAASAQIKMQDGGLVAMRPDTQLKFDSFKFSGKEDGSEQSFFSLFKGGFRAVTGLIGRINKPSYRITTPTSTIGIRGTDHETFVVIPGSPMAAVAPSGAYNKVNLGETSMTTDKGTISVLPNQMGFAGAKDQAPKLQPVNTNLFTVAAKPTPQAKSDKQEDKKESVRESAVVDNTSQQKAAAPAPAAAVAVNTVTTTIIQLPVETTNNIDLTGGGTDLAGGGTTPVTVPSAAYVQTDLAVAFTGVSSGAGGGFSWGNGSFVAAPADVANTLPNPSVTERFDGQNGGSLTYSLSGAVVGQAATTVNGITFGRWDSNNPAVLTSVFAGSPATSTSFPGPVQLHWIVGPAIDPIYLPEVLTGAATYTLAGGTKPTATLSGASPGGTASLNTASLTVNFTKQVVGIDLALTVNGSSWAAKTLAGNEAPLQSMNGNNAKSGFSAYTYNNSVSGSTSGCPAPCGSGLLTVTGGSSLMWGMVNGQLAGNALNGALLSYWLADTSGMSASGVAAFTGAAQNTATPYRIAALSGIDWNPPAKAGPGGPIVVATGGYNNAASVLTDTAGNVLQLTTDRAFDSGGALKLGIGTATATGLGTDPVSGISWGRWVGGTLSKTDLVTGSTGTHQNTVNADGTGAALSTHWVASPAMVGPVTLPISGTYNYVLAGGTAPTDSLGGVGTLNSATLSANFTAQTVAVGINVTTPNAGNLVAAGTAIPIEQKSTFGASTANTAGFSGSNNPGLLTVTCPAGCGTAGVTGHVGGGFTGAGGIGAAVVYGLDKGGVLVNGVAAFHR